MTRVEHARLTGERALFFGTGLDITDTIFADGESPLKHGSNLDLDHVLFEWKYPMWYTRNVRVKDSALLEMARSGPWYVENMSLTDTLISSPKTFRRSKGITLTGVDMPNAAETLWHCSDVTLDRVSASGDYFGMDSSSIKATHFRLSGNYLFDGGSDIEVCDSTILSKDAFWNCENVVVRDSLIVGEYLGWNSRNLTFINCTIESLQGLCYIDNLVMKNCRLLNTTLAFEYSTGIDAELVGSVDSIINPGSGVIRCGSVGELILDDEKVDHSLTRIITSE
ncbi:MAG: DUF3737 family protein [Propionibacteriaceae bacterium]|nr:DUF3737 family protein [Propionibacteriaceae bacterium]